MINKKIASEVAVGIILIIAIAIGGIFWMQNKKEEISNQQLVTSKQEVPIQKQEKENTGIANPASTFCVQNGGKSEIRTNPDSSQTGYCVFSSGSECEEWEYYRGECQEHLLVKEGKSNKELIVADLYFSLPDGWIIEKDISGKVYIKDVSYNSKYDSFLFVEESAKSKIDSVDFENSRNVQKFGNLGIEKEFGAWASYNIYLNGNSYLIRWNVFGNEPIPENVDGPWTPANSFSDDKILEMMKSAHL